MMVTTGPYDANSVARLGACASAMVPNILFAEK